MDRKRRPHADGAALPISLAFICPFTGHPPFYGTLTFRR